MAEVPPHDPIDGNHWLMTAEPQATPELRNDHLNAMMCPQGLEAAAVDLVRGWLSAADNWGHYTSLSVGANPGDGGILNEWKEAGEAIRALLQKYSDLALLAEELGQPTCRLNFPTLDRMIVSAMEWQEIESRLAEE